MANKIKISELIPDDKNFNKGSEYGNQLINKSFEKFGAGRSILIDKNNKIIAGNKSTENYGALGNEEVIIVESDGTKLVAVKRTDIDLDTPEGREMALADNATAKANIVWAEDVIAETVGVEMAESWGVDFKELEIPEAQEDDFNGTPPKEPITVLGDLYEIGEHRLLCGDSTDSDQVARLMDGQKADMVFTDPPYGVSYEGINNDDRCGLEELLTSAFSNYTLNVNNGASIYCFHSDRCADIFHKVFREYCHFSSMIIWEKESIVLSQTDYQSKHEPCLYGWFDNGTHKWYSDRRQESIWIAKSKREEGHTTPKPIEIVSKAINNSSLIKHLIMDLFLGSGSTMVASHQLKRKCYGMELDPKYCDVIVARMIKLMRETGSSLKIKRNGQQLKDKELQKFMDNTNG